ncbi:ion transporter [Flavobacteriaceae bacterium F08102]|nr:ion transporter [Flavobacteriaceae bacterium F08102]
MSNRSQIKWKSKLHEIIYEADTKAGKIFDGLLLVFIVASILLVMLESVDSLNAKYHDFFNIAEWVITILFSIEYIGRVIVVKRPFTYIFSFYGIIDLLSTIPKYLSLIFVGTHALVALRALRLMRIFRILKLARFVKETNTLMLAVRNSRAKISVFLFFIVIMAVILGTVMYLVEVNQNSGFTSIPTSVYWAVVTLTTVGYGDIAPVTAVGQFIATIIMVMGYGIIAIPTGMVTAEYVKKERVHMNTQVCQKCNTNDHRDGANFCYKCGHNLHLH